MAVLPKQVQDLIEEFAALPGIGPKSASRLAFYLLKTRPENLQRFGKTLSTLRDNLTVCSVCFNVAEKNPCVICSDTTRNRSVVCVVEEPLDVIAIEQTKKFNGLYHVLGGVISPLNNVRPEDLKISELVSRLSNDGVTEVIIATNPNLEGEATAMYIANKTKELPVRLSKLAAGLSVGADLEYTDQLTLSLALENRKEFQSRK